MNQGGYGDGMGGGGGEYYNNSYGYEDNQQQQYSGYNNAYGDQQQAYYQDGSQQQYQEEYYDGMNNNEYYYQEGQQQQQYDVQQQGYGENYGATQDAGVDPNSLFYPTQTPFVVHPNGTPDNYGNYDTVGDPISAIALDDKSNNGNVPSIMYVASHTSHQGNSKQSASMRHTERSDGVRGLSKKDPGLDRGSRMTVLYDDTDSASTGAGEAGYYGGRSIYSSFVAHPEGDVDVLDSLHSVMFGGGHSIVKSYATTTKKARPSHAYGPPFGPPATVHNSYSGHLTFHHGNQKPEEKHCMGISSIFPVSTPYFGSGGRVCSVSPHGVRVHTRGGMIMSNKSSSDSNGILCGMTCGELLGGEGSQFATVAGMSSYPKRSGSRRPQHVHCVDLNRDLKIVSSHTLVHDDGSRGSDSGLMMCVSDMATNSERNNIIVGCSDGTIRVLDGGRRNAEVAKMKAQIGGVAKVVVSENLICATGYSSTGVSSPSSPLPYPFPAPHVLIYDVRYLGRGGIPHMFSANRGGPRFVNFLPDGNLLVGSGIPFGSFEVITPFGDSAGSSFFQPELNAGESMTTVNVNEDELHIGTSYGRVLQYGLTNYDKTQTEQRPRGASGSGSTGGVGARSSTESGKTFGGNGTGKPLDMPPFAPLPPELSIDPAILCSSSRLSSDQPIKGWNVFDGYSMAANPLVSSDKSLFHPRYSRSSVATTTMGPMSTKPLVTPSKRWLSNQLQEILVELDKRNTGGSSGEADFVKVLPTSSLTRRSNYKRYINLSNLLEPMESNEESDTQRRNNRAKKTPKSHGDKATYPNPNKLIHCSDIFAACYDATADPRKKITRRASSELLEVDDLIDSEESHPRRYRLMVRPPFYKVTNFDYTSFNKTGLWVGWDYSPSFTNSFACSVLALLYFIPEIRDTALRLQLCSNDLAIQTGKSLRQTNVSVTAELGLLFHLIECLSANGMIQPHTENNQDKSGQVKAFVPSNFISAFALLPEATNLALLDGVAGSAELARRPEAFYRFLMQYMERELGQLVSHNEQTSSGHLIDLMQGIDFLSVIEYTRGSPKASTSRNLTVDLAYDQKWSSTDDEIRFGEILRFSLCKEAPLRAWCDETRSYEAVIQRKIATSLPSLLSMSCCCAGTKADTHGLQFWQQPNSRNWLPEFIEIEIETDRSITVKELVMDDKGEEEWVKFERKLPLSDSFFEATNKELPQNLPIKKSYRLDAVVSFVRTHANSSTESEPSHSCEGHHVVHVRVPCDFEIDALNKQLHQIEKCMAKGADDSAKKLTLVSGIALQERQKQVQEQLNKLKENETSDKWLLLNGFVVTATDSDDVRSFNAKFKEPSIVLFREIIDGEVSANLKPSKELSAALSRPYKTVPLSVMATSSISNGRGPRRSIADVVNVPANGALVAIDAEFVCVQPEESLITSSGSKEVISEPRNALARLSVIDCQTDEVIIDDYVLPREPVVDYLTRFSGVSPNDLDVKNSPHHLVTPEEAYLKVRLLMETGCIFVGHGLSQDFRVINICIPPNQIIDTAEIFHQPNQRYISLRYLTNYVLGRDMQQEVHDSIEDARAAFELYMKATSLKKDSKFDDYLMQLYAHGHKTQFKLGVAHDQ